MAARYKTAWAMADILAAAFRVEGANPSLAISASALNVLNENVSVFCSMQGPRYSVTRANENSSQATDRVDNISSNLDTSFIATRVRDEAHVATTERGVGQFHEPNSKKLWTLNAWCGNFCENI